MDGRGPGTAQGMTPGMTPAQQRASNPAASVWVGASAGTGKTKVLTDRVLRLLLGGTAPERLLCLTFTRAAAAEMALRIARELARWTVADDEALAGALAALTGARPEQDTLDRARRLFATVLDVPDGLKIQTIHAFCQSLLRRFPLEAGVAPNFQIADERMSTELLGAARARLLGAARPGAAGTLAPALAAMTAVVGEEGFGTLLATLSRERDRFAALLAGHGGIAGAVAALRDRLGVGAGVTADGVLADASAGDAFDRAGLAHAARTLAGGTVTDQRRALKITTWLDADRAQRAAGFAAYRRAFFRQDDAPLAKLITNRLADADPEAADALGREQARLGAVTERWNAARVAESSAALIAVAAHHLALYDDEKARHAVLDYGDQIAISRGLLARAGIAPWVLYKLDGGLDHLLIDEAQDTSPAQWAVIAALADEFFAGEGARAAPRTLFAVGDEKQSIFSFQGADARMRSPPPIGASASGPGRQGGRGNRCRLPSPSVRPPRCWARSMRCSPGRRPAPASRKGRRRSATRSTAGAPPAGSSCGRLSHRSRRKRRRRGRCRWRARRPTIRRRGSQHSSRSASGRGRRRRRRQGATPGWGPAAGRSGPATCWCWCAAAAPSWITCCAPSRPARCRWRGSTAWC